jgi:hypothetical protein
MAKTKIEIKNIVGYNVIIRDLNDSNVLAGATLEVSDTNSYDAIKWSTDLNNAINNDEIFIVIDNIVQTKDNSLVYMQAASFPEAPNDNQEYARKNLEWSLIKKLETTPLNASIILPAATGSGTAFIYEVGSTTPIDITALTSTVAGVATYDASAKGVGAKLLVSDSATGEWDIEVLGCNPTTQSLTYAKWGSETERTTTGNVQDFLTADIIDYDPTGAVVANGTFTAQNNGLYRFDLVVDCSNNSATDNNLHFTSFFYTKNGGTKIQFGHVQHTSDMNNDIQRHHYVAFDFIDLVQGDTIRLFIGDDATIATNNIQNLFRYDVSVMQLPTAVAPIVNTVAENGENIGISGSFSALADIAGSSFTLPSEGVFDVTYMITGTNTTTDAGVVGIYTSSDALVEGSQSNDHTQNSYPTIFSGFKRITTTGAETFKLKGQMDAGTFTIRNNPSIFSPVTGGISKISWVKVAGTMSAITSVNVDNTNALTGKVLTWNALTTEYIPEYTKLFHTTVTAPIITANQNDYAPAGLAPGVVLRVSATANRTIRGFSSVGFSDRDTFLFINTTDFNMVFTNNSGLSLAGNRILLSGNSTVERNHSVIFIYDGTALAWRILSRNN